jgi:hypothetical protein
MPRRAFRTVAEELLDAAEIAADHFANHGYSVRVEKHELGFPYTPTMICKRQSTTLIVEVDILARLKRLQEWVAFAKSTSRDTRIVLVIPAEAVIDAKSEAALRSLGIGLVAASEEGCVERLVGRDLALGVQLPELSQLPRKVQRILGPAYEQFGRGQWREGFEEACQALEREARRYLKAGLRSTRIKIVRKKDASPSASEVDKMTMGQLAGAFTSIESKNKVDSLIGETLKTVNKDRIGVAHHKAKKRTETRLRSNVGRHMWSVVAVMKEVSS